MIANSLGDAHRLIERIQTTDRGVHEFDVVLVTVLDPFVLLLRYTIPQPDGTRLRVYREIEISDTPQAEKQAWRMAFAEEDEWEQDFHTIPAHQEGMAWA